MNYTKRFFKSLKNKRKKLNKYQIISRIKQKNQKLILIKAFLRKVLIMNPMNKNKNYNSKIKINKMQINLQNFHSNQKGKYQKILNLKFNK